MVERRLQPQSLQTRGFIKVIYYVYYMLAAEVGRAWLILTPRQNVCSNRNQERLFAGLAVLQRVMSEHYESQGSSGLLTTMVSGRN